MLRRFLLTWLVVAIAFAIVVLVFPGVDFDWSPGAYLGIAALFGIVNALIGPIMRLFSLPLRVMTLGLFSLVINGALLLITSWLSDNLDVDGLFVAIGAALVLTIVEVVMEKIVVDRVAPRRK